MRRISAAIAAASLAVSASAAEVDRGNGSYFNRPGASVDAMLAAVAECRARAEGADSQINGIPVLTAGLAAVIGGAIADGRLKRVNIENCMLIRGWRLFAMTDAEGKVWKALSDGERRNAMRYSADLEGARTALAVEYPRLAGRLAAWSPRNGSTYSCEGDEFTAYAVPGAPAIEGSAPAR